MTKRLKEMGEEVAALREMQAKVEKEMGAVPGLLDQCVHKSRLHQYIQKSTLPAPIYHTVKEGSPHEPKFLSTVSVDGVDYKSQPCRRRKEAEQDAARIALDTILKKSNERGCTILYEDISCCKSILHEFAVKMSLDLPTYTTTRTEGSLPIFSSTLAFHGKTYSANPGRSKKEAEQFGARIVILSILGTESGPHLSEIINAKRKFYDDAVGKAAGNVVAPIQVKTDTETVVLDAPPLKKPKLEVESETPLGVEGASSSSYAGTNPRKKNKKKGVAARQLQPIIQPVMM